MGGSIPRHSDEAIVFALLRLDFVDGDNAGVAGGIKSAKFMGPTKFKKGVSNVKIKGKPATKLLMPTSHNADNGVGVTLAPSQTKVMCTK